jgi:hypothetical protein
MQLLYAEGIVVDDDMQFDFEEQPAVTLMGAVRFGTAVELKVKKFLRIDRHGRYECLVTKCYSYQCHVVGQTDSEIFRYDNYHEHNPHDGHGGPHHVHRFDPPGREVLGSPFHIKDEDRPLLDEIIREAHKHSEAYKATPTMRKAAKPRRGGRDLNRG